MSFENYKILYLDDEHQNLVSFRAAFRRYFDVYVAKDSSEALDLLNQHAFQVIITDHRMPDITGVQFLEQVIASHPDTIRMIMTGYSDVEAVIEAINNGRVYRYITKPWDNKELKLTIENAFQLHDLQLHNKNLFKELQHKVSEQEKTLKLFSKYVPESIIHKNLNAQDDKLFDGEHKHVSIMFCDIRKFTQIASTLPPKEVVRLLNCYYETMNHCIKKHGGSINQFVGDEIFAIFGAPISIADPEYRAARCAIDMRNRLTQITEKTGITLQIGIGIHAGEVIAGNLGTEDKIEYSITGDAVNFAKRIESLTKDHANQILISSEVYQKIKGQLNVVEKPANQVKGYPNPIITYELV